MKVVELNLGVNMNYKRIYEELIEYAKKSRELKGYTETHHIIPRCLLLDDSKGNLVTLTAREHFIAHWLLTKIYKDTEHEMTLLAAFTAMNMKNSTQGREFNLNRKNALAYAYSESVKGENNPMYGKSPHNLNKKVWYLPEEDVHIFSENKPTLTAIEGKKIRESGVRGLKGSGNGMHGVNLLNTFDEEKVASIMDNRRATFESKTDEEKAIVFRARAFGYEFFIKDEYYPTLKHAESATGFSHKAITSRCQSDREEFKDWTRKPRDCKYISSPKLS